MEKKENSWYQPQKRVKSRIKACTTAGNLVRQAKSIFFSLSIQGKKKEANSPIILRNRYQLLVSLKSEVNKKD